MTEFVADAMKGLTRQERVGFRLSRQFPRATGRANRVVY